MTPAARTARVLAGIVAALLVLDVGALSAHRRSADVRRADFGLTVARKTVELSEHPRNPAARLTLEAQYGRVTSIGPPSVLLLADGAFSQVELGFEHGGHGVERHLFDAHGEVTGTWTFAVVAAPLDPGDIDADIRTRTARVLDAHARGDYGAIADLFDQTMRVGLSATAMEVSERPLLARAGRELERAPTEFVVLREGTVTTTLVAYQHAVLMLRITWDRAHRIAGYYLLDPTKIG